MTNVDLELKSLAPIAAASFFCVGLKKALAKKDIAESGKKLQIKKYHLLFDLVNKLLKIDFGETF